MAVLKTNVMRKQSGIEHGRVMPSYLGGRVRLIHAAAIPSEDLGKDSVVEIARLPKGARLLPLSQVHLEGGKDFSCVIKVGDALSPGRYLAETTVLGQNVSICLDGGKFNDFLPDRETAVFATISDGSIAAGNRIVFDILYVVD